MKPMKLILLLALFSTGIAHVNGQDSSSFAYQKPLFDFDVQKPVFRLEGEQLSNKNRFLRFNALTGYREGVKPTEGPFGLKFQVFDDFEAGTVKFVQYNLSIADLLSQGVYRQIVLEVKDPSKYSYIPEYGDKEAWMRKNAFCFEYVFPLVDSDLRTRVQQSIADFLGVKFRTEKRMMKNPETGEMKEERVFVITEQDYKQ